MLLHLSSLPLSLLLHLSLPALAAASPISSPTAAADDWLVTPVTTPSAVHENVCWPEYGEKVCGIEITNGLTARRFVTSPAFGTIDWLRNATVERGGLESMFRAVEPEASLSVDGAQYTVGGLISLTQSPIPAAGKEAAAAATATKKKNNRNSTGSVKNTRFRAYCNRSDFAAQLGVNESAAFFRYSSHRISAPVAPFPWTPGTRHGAKELSWPPKGVTLVVEFTVHDPTTTTTTTTASVATNPNVHPNAAVGEGGGVGVGAPPLLSDLLVTMYYEIYDGIPLLSKWMTITTQSAPTAATAASTAVDHLVVADHVIDAVMVERFAAMPRFGAADDGDGALHPGQDWGGVSTEGNVIPPPLLHVKTDQVSISAAVIVQRRWTCGGRW